MFKTITPLYRMRIDTIAVLNCTLDNGLIILWCRVNDVTIPQ